MWAAVCCKKCRINAVPKLPCLTVWEAARLLRPLPRDLPHRPDAYYVEVTSLAALALLGVAIDEIFYAPYVAAPPADVHSLTCLRIDDAR